MELLIAVAILLALLVCWVILPATKSDATHALPHTSASKVRQRA